MGLWAAHYFQEEYLGSNFFGFDERKIDALLSSLHSFSNKFGKEIPRIEHFCVGSVKVEICKILPNLLTSMFSSYRERWNKDRQEIPVLHKAMKKTLIKDREVAILTVSAVTGGRRVEKKIPTTGKRRGHL
jgi:hypothetical protein